MSHRGGALVCSLPCICPAPLQEAIFPLFQTPVALNASTDIQLSSFPLMSPPHQMPILFILTLVLFTASFIVLDPYTHEYTMFMQEQAEMSRVTNIAARWDLFFVLDNQRASKIHTPYVACARNDIQIHWVQKESN